MIIDLPSTTTNAISHRIVDLRGDSGALALSRVLTLVTVSDESHVDDAIGVSNAASREHPCRVLALAIGNRRGSSRLDAQIRVGGDAGASEVIVLRLYGPLAAHGESLIVPLLLPDAPIVVWWPREAPDSPAADPIGQMAQRRITDASFARNPVRAIKAQAATSRPGDTDLAWSRLTRWRALLAAALDQPPYEPIRTATVAGAPDSPSAELLAGWLALALHCPVQRKRTAAGSGITGVSLVRESGTVSLDRPDGNVATLSQPGQPVRRIAMPRRGDEDCLTEELRRLDPDELFGDVLTKGLALLDPAKTAAKTTKRAVKPSAKSAKSAKSAAPSATKAGIRS